MCNNKYIIMLQLNEPWHTHYVSHDNKQTNNGQKQQKYNKGLWNNIWQALNKD